MAHRRVEYPLVPSPEETRNLFSWTDLLQYFPISVRWGFCVRSINTTTTSSSVVFRGPKGEFEIPLFVRFSASRKQHTKLPQTGQTGNHSLK